MEKIKIKVNHNSAKLLKESEEPSLYCVIEKQIQPLSHRDLLYLSRSISTGDIRYFRRLSNPGKKVYSTVKQSFASSGNKSRSKVKTARWSKEEVVGIIDNIILSKEQDMIKGIDPIKLYNNLDSE
jgi:hypothetical protein